MLWLNCGLNCTCFNTLFAITATNSSDNPFARAVSIACETGATASGVSAASTFTTSTNGDASAAAANPGGIVLLFLLVRISPVLVLLVGFPVLLFLLVRIPVLVLLVGIPVLLFLLVRIPVLVLLVGIPVLLFLLVRIPRACVTGGNPRACAGENPRGDNDGSSFSRFNFLAVFSLFVRSLFLDLNFGCVISVLLFCLLGVPGDYYSSIIVIVLDLMGFCIWGQHHPFVFFVF